MQAAGIFADAGRTDCFDADTYHVCAFNSDKRRYIAEFEYKGIHYQIKGTIEKEEFEKILENLFFI